MAKKKLNKKVAIAGSIVLVLFALAAIWVILYKMQGPQKFIDDGDAAVAKKDYESAAKQYARALSRAKTDIELQKKILFKLSDTHILNNDWRKAMACWGKIKTIDTSETVSRTKLLDFYYDMADSGQYGAWKIVLTSVDELLPLEPKNAKLYLIKGRAKLELAKGGEVVERTQALTETIDILKKAQELALSNPNVYRYLAEAAAAKGEELATKGSLEEKNKAMKQTQQLLEKAIAVAPKDPNSYIQLLNAKLLAAKDIKQIGALEPDYIALTKKFPETSDVFSALVMYYNYYDLNKQDVSDIDKALNAAQRAQELSPQSAKYAIAAADLYYRKGSVTKDDKYLQKAIDLAKNALTLPSAMDTQGSREYANKMNKLSLNTFLAYRSIERILDLPANASKQQKDALILNATDAVHEIAQIWGSGEQPYVIEAEGMLAYAKGDTAEGIRKMYTAYQQLKQADPKGQDAQLGQLSYVLARAFDNSSEIGATRDFLLNALQRRIHFTKPETLLMYAQISMPLRQYPDIINVVDMYEKIAGPTTTSQLLRARADIGAGQIDEAQKLLAKMKSDDPNIIATKLSLLQTRIDQASAASRDPNAARTQADAIKAEIDKYRNEQITLAQKLLLSEPNAAQALAMVVENYLARNKTQEAKAAVAAVLTRAPDNSIAAFYKLLLAEPDPLKISPQRRMALTEQASAAIHDPVKRALAMADFYKSKLSEEMAECYKTKSAEPAVIATTDSQKRSLMLASMLADCYKSNANYDKIITEYKNALNVDPANKAAISGIFDTALQANDFSLAEQTAGVAKRENTDLCGGQLFMARLSLVKKDYKEAMSRLDAAIKERPVSAVAYLLRSSAQSELGNEQLAIEDARKSVELNPLDSMAAKNLANLLYQRNLKLGAKVSTEQITEARTAIERAYASNPRDWQLLSFYAEYIRDTDPVRSLSIRQQLQKAIPTAQNALLLGNLAVKLASEQKDKDTAKQKGYYDIAAAAYEQGYKLDPNDSALLRSYAEFYNLIGKPQQADQLLNKAANKNLLWVHQMRIGQFEQARQTLDKLYKENPKNIDVLKGQMLVAQNLGNAEAVTKYSQELLSFENTPENQLAQIEAYLQVNLVEPAQKQLASYMEKHPDDNRTMLLQALLAIHKGQFTEAIAFINKNLELKPNDATSWNLKGQIDFSRGDFDDAVNDFKKAKSTAPSPQIRTALTRAYLRAGKGDDAIKELTSAIDETPGATDLYVMLEQTYAQLGKADALARFYQDAIKQFPDTPYWYNRAASFAISQKDLDTAAALSKAALELSQKPNPNIPKEAMRSQEQIALDNYLTVMRLKKQYDQLVTYASQYVDSDLAVVAFAAMADAKAELGDKTKAFEYYNKAMLKAASNDAVVFQLLGKMNNTVGQEETMKWCSLQLKTTPDSLPINLAMCNIMRSSKETGKALTYIDKCIQLAGPKNSNYRNFIDTKQAILLEAYTATSDKKYLNEAVKLYEDLIAGSSSVEVGALNNLAYLLASNDENIDKAVEYIKKAYDATQNNPDIMDTYAYVLYKKGDYTKALELAQSAVRMQERTSVSAPADVYEHLGMISAKLGRKTEAANAYKQALKIGEKTLSEQAKKRITTAIAALK